MSNIINILEKTAESDDSNGLLDFAKGQLKRFDDNIQDQQIYTLIVKQILLPKIKIHGSCNPTYILGEISSKLGPKEYPKEIEAFLDQSFVLGEIMVLNALLEKVRVEGRIEIKTDDEN